MRPSKHNYFSEIANVVSSRATCCRRKVGCVLVNSKGHILATGYNGTAAGLDNCSSDDPCNPEARDSKSGENLHLCEAIHAEQNALLKCKDVHEIDIAYVTHSPCITCVKLLMNTSCKTIVFSEPYPHDEAKRLWEASGRHWLQFNSKRKLT